MSREMTATTLHHGWEFDTITVPTLCHMHCIWIQFWNGKTLFDLWVNFLSCATRDTSAEDSKSSFAIVS